MYEVRKKLNQDAELQNTAKLPRPFSGVASSATVPTSLSVPMSRRSIREAWPKSSRPTPWLSSQAPMRLEASLNVPKLRVSAAMHIQCCPRKPVLF